MLFQTVPSRPYGLLFPKIRVHNPHPVHSQGPSEQKPIKNFGEKGAWAYPGTAQIF